MRRALAIALLLAGCGPARSSPDGTYLAFARALDKYDVKTCWEQLSTPTRARLMAAAATSARALGKPAPKDAISLAFGASNLLVRKVSKVEIESATATEATLLVTDDHGEQERVHMVAEDRAWRLDLTSAFPSPRTGPGAD